MKASEWAQEIVDEWDGLSPKEVEDTLSADGVTTWWNYDLARAYLRLREAAKAALMSGDAMWQFYSGGHDWIEAARNLYNTLEETDEMD